MSHKDKVAANKAKLAPVVAVSPWSELALAVGYMDELKTRFPNATQKFLDFRTKQYWGTYREALGYVFQPSPGKGRHGQRTFVRTTLILPTEQMTKCGHSNKDLDHKDYKHCRFAQGCTDCLPDKQKAYTRAITPAERALAARIRRRDIKARPSLLDRIAASTEAARKIKRDKAADEVPIL